MKVEAILLVFHQVIPVACLKQFQQRVEWPKSGQPNADLKVNQIRFAVRPNQYVLRFMQIDVGDIAIVDLGQERVEFLEICFANLEYKGERLPSHKIVRDCGVQDFPLAIYAAVTAGNSLEVSESSQKIRFTSRQ
jgi:hypothetical protein